MEDAKFDVSTPYILGKMVASLSDEKLGLNDKDMMGDCYEYLLSKMATSGDNGQFRQTHLEGPDGRPRYGHLRLPYRHSQVFAEAL